MKKILFLFLFLFLCFLLVFCDNNDSISVYKSDTLTITKHDTILQNIPYCDRIISKGVYNCQVNLLDSILWYEIVLEGYQCNKPSLGGFFKSGGKRGGKLSYWNIGNPNLTGILYLDRNEYTFSHDTLIFFDYNKIIVSKFIFKIKNDSLTIQYKGNILILLKEKSTILDRECCE